MFSIVVVAFFAYKASVDSERSIGHWWQVRSVPSGKPAPVPTLKAVEILYVSIDHEADLAALYSNSLILGRQLPVHGVEQENLIRYKEGNSSFLPGMGGIDRLRGKAISVFQQDGEDKNVGDLSRSLTPVFYFARYAGISAGVENDLPQRPLYVSSLDGLYGAFLPPNEDQLADKNEELRGTDKDEAEGVGSQIFRVIGQLPSEFRQVCVRFPLGLGLGLLFLGACLCAFGWRNLYVERFFLATTYFGVGWLVGSCGFFLPLQWCR